MSRGCFDFLKRTPAYTDSKKDWYVELINSTCFWFDLLIDPPEGVDVMARVRHCLNTLKDTVQRNLNRHFIYFLVSRKRVRFSTRRRPRYSLIRKRLVLYIEVGRERKEQKCVTFVIDPLTGKFITPSVRVTDRIITFISENGSAFSYPIHDFLDHCCIETGINSEVHYVGYTSNPSARAIDRNHRGLADAMFWQAKDEEAYDYFIFYNLFKVTSIAANQANGMNFAVSNAMVDEVDVEREGKILEKILIKYFASKTQKWNQSSELGELNNRLKKLAEEHRINSVTFDIEMEEPSELFRFFSSSVEPTDKHNFTCQLGSAGAEIVEAKNFYAV